MITREEFVTRILVAFVAGLIIGLERQWYNKSAGLRTNCLVALGSALYVLLSIKMTSEHGDVTRIIGQVVTGIGFLGAGIIFKEGLNIHGLTTAATVWCSSAVGSVAAAGFFFEAAVATGLIVVVNAILKPIDEWVVKKSIERKAKTS